MILFLLIIYTYPIFAHIIWENFNNLFIYNLLAKQQGKALLSKYHNFNGITSRFGAHFILIIDKILIKEKYEKSILEKATRRNYAPIPTNWGYRDSANFWCSKFNKPYSLPIPKRNADLESLRYAALRLNTNVKFTDDALMVISGAPRAFLKLILKGCAEWAERKGYTVISEKEMTEMNEERKAKKKKK